MDPELAPKAHGGPADPYITRVAVTIVILAALAAAAGSLATLESSWAMSESSRAVVAQDRATNAWNEYQAATLKRHMDDIATENGSSHFYRDSQNERAAGDKAWHEATDAERERDTRLRTSSAHERHAGWLTGAATLAQIAVVLSAIAIITRRRYFWFTAVGLGVIGMLLFGAAYAI